MRKRKRIYRRVGEGCKPATDFDKLIMSICNKYGRRRGEVSFVYWRIGKNTYELLDSYYRLFSSLVEVYPDIPEIEVHRAIQDNESAEMIKFQLNVKREMYKIG